MSKRVRILDLKFKRPTRQLARNSVCSLDLGHHFFTTLNFHHKIHDWSNVQLDADAFDSQVAQA